MKSYFLTILTILAMNDPLFSQDTVSKHIRNKNQDEIQTLFSHKDHHAKMVLGWYVSPTASVTEFGDKMAFMPGIEGGVILNHFFSIGLAATITANANNLYFKRVQDTMGANFIGGYAGVKMEFSVFPKFPVHFSFPILIGGGASAYIHQYDYDYANGYDFGHKNYYKDCEVLDWNTFFVLEPGIRAEINIVKFLRFWVGATYRWVPDYHFHQIKYESDFMNNFNLGAGLKFGKF